MQVTLDAPHLAATAHDANLRIALTLQMEHLTDAQALLLAAQYAATPDLSRLRLLAAIRQDVLHPSIVYRTLLTYLPLDASHDVRDTLCLLLKDLNSGFSNFSTLDASNEHDSHVDLPTPRDAERSLSSLRLQKLPRYTAYEQDDNSTHDILSDFLIAWLHKLEDFGTLDVSATHLVDQFVAQHPLLETWNKTYLRPLHRLRNEYYPGQSDPPSLTNLETTYGETGVAMLLRQSAQSASAANIKRDIQEIVTPWIIGSGQAKRRKLDTTTTEQQHSRHTSWSDVNKWLFTLAHTNYSLAAATVEQWDGPLTHQGEPSQDGVIESDDDVTVAYIRTIIAMIYTSNEHDQQEHLTIKKNLLRRAAYLAQLMPPDFELSLPNIPDPGSLRRSTRSELLETALLLPTNELTKPSTDVIDFLYGVLSSQSILTELKLESTTQSITSTVLFESEQKQKHELRTILTQVPRLTKSSINWVNIREQIRWLHHWSQEVPPLQNQSQLAYLDRLSTHSIELEILDSMLAANEYQSVKDIYLFDQSAFIPVEDVKQHIKDAIFNAYDNASNGNRTRGGVKKASEILSSFRSYFTDTADFEHIEYLIKATHSLSFYQLTLQHGVPFQPVSIRVSKDPLSLIGKVLDQNSKAYTKLDDLIGIAHNLVKADLPVPIPQDFTPGEIVPVERRLQDAEHRVTYLAITAALTDHDFDTAYSLITTRLTSSRKQTATNSNDDTSWRAAYAAGKYRPAHSPSDIHKRISSLSQRMDLLSTALILAPTAEVLPEILATWRRCEEEMESLKSQAVQEERALDTQSDNLLPGAFGPSDRDLDANETKRLLETRRGYNSTGPSYEEEAPMGLFDVAKGAASALRKNAFPLRGGVAPGQQESRRTSSRLSVGDSMRSSEESERPGSADGQRVRKRDMLSNAVTGTLVGGMSWMLGAQPVHRAQQGQE